MNEPIMIDPMVNQNIGENEENPDLENQQKKKENLKCFGVIDTEMPFIVNFCRALFAVVLSPVILVVVLVIALW
eukprot:CAMPEP_0114578370 /NCGR_PEP_ID=MMETSP0125-20121206/2918_1 /TAXON_ID=485358 ORGANISM="Aristerostoma sp., Strain ATCC 50986" /NCGR_SAMPLE_ID=MMETSP0125 /ASSEMBLY_ACC=CAM_ASM_000245 /LENGTH=73 /DNA_ID=CAMNT_0001768389 /DNA_START=156 /DNA_END=374 /DNA_ORIENTATION=+